MDMATKKVTITIEFNVDMDQTDVNGESAEGAIGETAVNAFVQLETLTDDYGIKYDGANYNVKIGGK
jgi:hypothetical protein